MFGEVVYRDRYSPEGGRRAQFECPESFLASNARPAMSEVTEGARDNADHYWVETGNEPVRVDFKSRTILPHENGNACANEVELQE